MPKTTEELSSSFLSLVDSIKLQNAHSETYKSLLALLREITPGYGSTTTHHLFFRLIPNPEMDARGFTDAMLTLIQSPNEDLVVSALGLIRDALAHSNIYERIAFMKSGFFSRLSPSFQQRDVHLSPYCGLYFIHIVTICLNQALPSTIYWQPGPARFIDQPIHRILFQNVIRHLTPFFTFLCSNYLRMLHQPQSTFLLAPFTVLVIIASFSEDTTQFLCQSPCFVSITAYLAEIEDQSNILEFLEGIRKSQTVLEQHVDKAVQMRRKRILAHVREEGVADSVEQQLHRNAAGLVSSGVWGHAVRVLSAMGGGQTEPLIEEVD
ncbi:hypothetical protein BLNAU_10529 [Blattamonas nauphoetae]|uniref:Uncharacterized protein n=1 Tax=Blattamonas nauphoetae TaxID=2049346 RepID=A0ABQ9XRW2_9EUKA|nr:hypothetical protein BLNAU_10529 [Blattamonas nauphoetae]